MAALPQPDQSMTETEYLKFEQQSDIRHEYVDGEIFAMTGGTWSHSMIISNTNRSLGNQLVDTPCESVSSETRVRVTSSKAYRYPDVMVVCGEPQFYEDRTDIVVNPIVLIEVLSPSSITIDVFEKFAEYTKISTLEEYLIIEQDKPRIMCYNRQNDDTWLYTDAVGIDSVLNLPSINCTLKLSEVYRTITFDSDTPND